MGLLVLVQMLLGPNDLSRSLPSWAVLRLAKSSFLFIVHQDVQSPPSDSGTSVHIAMEVITKTETSPHRLFLSRCWKQKFPQLARGTTTENL